MVNQDHVNALLDGMNAVDRAVKQCIVDELAPHFETFTAAEEKAAARLAAAIEALSLPESQIAAIDADLAIATEKASEVEKDTGDDWMVTRVHSRAELASWQEEISRLRQKRQQAEDAIKPFHDERNNARKALEAAQEAKLGYALALTHPYGPVGRGTSAYMAFRVRAGHLIPILLSGDTTHPEWGVAFQFLDELAERSGYRTDHLDKDAEKVKKSWDSIYDQANPATPAPTMAEVMEEDIRTLRNIGAMEQSKKTAPVIDDYRQPVPDRPYMRLPGKG